jgi:hypothetical protein
MRVDELERRLTAEHIVPLTAGEWAALADVLDEIERHHTMVAGDLLVVRTAAGLAAVERPTRDERVVRLLGEESAVSAFVAERMAQYERMWDGCGCRVDYYA